MTSTKLTEQQRWVLTRLAEKTPNRFGGVNPNSIGHASGAATARRLERRGLVSLTRISDLHIRYSITEAGRAALQQGGGDHHE